MRQHGPAAEPNVRRRLSPDARRRQIVDGAVAYFAEVGFDGGTRELAKRLGITQPLIYRYFPSKEDLVREVYEAVYVGRWQPEWEGLLTDRRRALRDRLIAFYERYTAAIFEEDWLRIYLFSGLKGLEINRWWIAFVEERILRRIAEEVRAAYDLPGPDAVAVGGAEMELYWVFHGGIFYYGLRRHVYGIRPHLERRSLITVGVDTLLAGMPRTLEQVLDTAAASSG